MKKLATTVGLLAMILMFNACNDSPSDPGLDPGNEQPPIEENDPPVSDSGFIELSGSINSDSTLKNIFDDPAKKDYLVTGDLSVNAKLTVEPGVVVHLEENILLSINKDGVISAEGTAQDSIIFTTANKAGGLLWKGIMIESSSGLNSMKYVNISYAGSSTLNFGAFNDYKTAVGVNSNAKISIENSHIHHNEGYGVYTETEGGTLITFANNKINDNALAGLSVRANTVSSIEGNNEFSNNALGAVEIKASTFDEGEETWHALPGDADYFVSGDLNINEVLTVEPGVKFEMAEDVLWTVNGALIANGTDTDKITFTSVNKDAGLHWKGIFIPSADSRNSFDHTVLSYGGNSTMNFGAFRDFPAIIGVHQTGKASLTNSEISNSKGYGFYVEVGGGQLEDFANNTFIDNARHVGLPANEVDEVDSNTTFSGGTEADVEIFSTTYSKTKESTWKPLNGDAYYRVTGDLAIAGTLTIAPNAKFEMDEDVLIDVTGAFIAVGSSGNEIIFTSSNIPGGLHWKGIFVRSSDTRNELNFANVAWGGRSKMNFGAFDDYKTNIGIGDNGRLEIRNSNITNSAGYGIWSSGENNDFSSASANNIFSNNVKANVSGTIVL